MPMPEEKGARSLAKRKEGEIGAGSRSRRAMAVDALGPRRSPRLMKAKEASQLEERILKLKREILMEIRIMRGQPAIEEPEGNKRKKVVKTTMPEDFMEDLVKNPYDTWDLPQEELVKSSKELQEFCAKRKVLSSKMSEYQLVLVKQYLDYGFVEDYDEVSDDDDEKI